MSRGLSQKLSDICTTEILYAYTDEPLSEALDRMAARGLHQLPVVERDNHEQVLGLLERQQIALACNVAVTRKALRHYLPVLPKTDIVLSQESKVQSPKSKGF